jgi:hypothetical protein
MNESQADAWNTANIEALELCATDNCALFTVSSNYNFGNLLPDCGFTGTLLVTYTITDECDNSTPFQATLTIVDTTPPELSVNDPLMDGVESGDTVLI